MSLSPSLRTFFDLVKSEAGAPMWSQGVTLSRSASVMRVPSRDSNDDDEIVVRVRMPTDLVARTVKLFPGEDDWLCDCKTRDRVCEHTACAIIVVRGVFERDETLPEAGGETVRPAQASTTHSGVSRSGTPVSSSGFVWGKLVYRLERSNGGLKLGRVIASSQGESPILGSVAAAAMSTGKLRLSPEALDYEIESLFGNRPPPAWTPPGLIPPLLKLLTRVEGLTLDGKPIFTDTRPVGLVVRVEDYDAGPVSRGPTAFMVTVKPDDRISETFNDNVARCGDRLHPLGESGLTARELQDFKAGKVYRGADVSELVTVVLPGLEKRARLEVVTRRLPAKTRERPRLVLDVETRGHELHVLPTLVYGSPPIARVDGERLHLLGELLPLRDEGEERRLIRRLEGQLGIRPGQRLIEKGEAAVALAARLRRFDADVDGDLEDFYLAPPVIPRLTMRGDDFDLTFEAPSLDASRRTADPKAVLAAFRDGAGLVPLVGGGWSPLPTDWLRQHGTVIANLLAARDEVGSIPTAATPDLARLCAALDLPPPPRLERLRALLGPSAGALEGAVGVPSAALPTGLQATLRDYQRRGVDWLTFLRSAGLGALLADDMGLGKTLQAACALEGRSLVVAPTSVVFNWSRELARFRPNLRVVTHQGARRKLDPDADVTITSYALLRLDADLLASVHWDTVILDEAQAIKNPDSQVARAAYRLDAGFRATLTGTPIENRLDELWSQFHFINRGLLGGLKDFQERWAKPIAEGKPGVAAELRDRIRPFVLRRTKREVAPELPPRTEVVLRCELSDEERTVYEAIQLAARSDVAERLGAGGSVIEALEALLRMRQACCHRGLIPGQTADSSSKVELLLETLEEAVSEGHKALVFSQWTSLLDRVEPHLQKAGIAFDRLDGSTIDRQGVVERFQADDGPPVLLLSLKAGGTGLNLTAADHVFLLDPWWNPAAEDQAADRAHRIGQDRPVVIHRLVAAETVEERILELQASKRALSEAALSGADRSVQLSRDDLLSLLGG